MSCGSGTLPVADRKWKSQNDFIAHGWRQILRPARRTTRYLVEQHRLRDGVISLNEIPLSTLNPLEIRLVVRAPAGITAGNFPRDA